MAKKKAPTRRQATRKSNNIPVFNITTEDVKIQMNITDESGKLLKEITESVYILHRLIVQSQVKEDGTPTEGAEYIPRLAKLLSETYGVKIPESSAYQIAEIVFTEFHAEKKSTVN